VANLILCARTVRTVEEVVSVIAIIPLCILDMYQDLEVVGFDLINVNPPVRVFIIYRPPHYDQVAVDLVNTLVSFLVRYATGTNKQHVIVGDLNYHASTGMHPPVTVTWSTDQYWILL